MASPPQARRGGVGARRPGSVAAWLVALAALALLVAACAPEEPAFTPVVDRDALEQIGTVTARRASPAATPTHPRQPLIRGATAAQHVYFTVGGDLWQLPIDGPARPVFTGREIVAYAPSADGKRVVVVAQAPSVGHGAGQSVAIVNADGTVALDLARGEGASSEAGVSDVQEIAWSPTGTEIAAAHADGSITLIAADGSMRRLVPPRQGSVPGDLSWSSDGAMLAYVDPALPNRPSSLYVVVARTGERRRLVAADDADDAVRAAVWLPGQARLAYVRGSATNAGIGGDVLAVDAAGGYADLLVPSGAFAPVAGVVDLAVSPDGHYLAVTVFTPGEPGARFQGLWVQDLQSDDFAQVPTERGEEVTDLWWAAGRLIYRVIDADQAGIPGDYSGTERFTLYQYDPATGATVPRLKR